jgi:hypothetical protein
VKRGLSFNASHISRSAWICPMEVSPFCKSSVDRRETITPSPSGSESQIWSCAPLSWVTWGSPSASRSSRLASVSKPIGTRVRRPPRPGLAGGVMRAVICSRAVTRLRSNWPTLGSASNIAAWSTRERWSMPLTVGGWRALADRCYRCSLPEGWRRFRNAPDRSARPQTGAYSGAQLCAACRRAFARRYALLRGLAFLCW